MRAIRFRHSGRVAPAFLTSLALALFSGVLVTTGPALALSEIKREELPSTPQDDAGARASPDLTAPAPEPIQAPDEEMAPEDEEEPGDIVRPEIDPDLPLPEIIYNLDRLPEPVRRMHGLIIEAAKSGEIERLRPIIGIGDDGTQLSFGGVPGDPIDFLKELSGDDQGQEILAILEEVLSAGYVRLEAGTPNELYVWPYFLAIPLDRLDARQRVELFKIVTAGDYEDMKAFGAYIFYRVGITPEGRWAFFVAGD